MSWSKWAFTPKFNYATGNYEGFWQESEINYFVDTIKGSDSNTGKAGLPFKTLGKVKSLGTGIWENGLIIMVNGTLNETCSIDKAVRIIGTGGDNGRCVFDGNGGLYIRAATYNVDFQNIIFKNYTTGSGPAAINTTLYCNNIIASTAYFQCYGNHYTYNSAYVMCNNYSAIAGRNNTFISPISTAQTVAPTFNDPNNHRTDGTFSATNNNLTGTNSRYFTDNTETTPAQLLIDPANRNFNFKKNVYIWDKTAQAYITTNPLFEMGTFNPITQKKNHIGSGYESKSYNGLNSIFIDTSQGGTATYSNIQVDSSGYLSRINDGIDGVLTSGIGYLGKTVKGVTILLPQTFTGTKRIIKTTPSIRVIQDIEFRWGASESAVNAADWCLIEYGKPIYYSLNGTTRIGNADPLFDIANALIAEISYFQFKITFKNI